MNSEWTSKGIHCSRDGACQRSDWFYGDEYAFHEWTYFPRFHQIMAHVLRKLPPPEEKIYYWLNGHAKTIKDMRKRIADAGLNPKKFTYEEEPYGEGYFPVAHSFEDACEYFLKTKTTLDPVIGADADEDICGLCGEPGADKFAHPCHWPGETIPNGPLVHAECEAEECRRAHAELTDDERKAFLGMIR